MQMLLRFKHFLALGLLLPGLSALASPGVVAKVEYFYAPDGTLTGRAINGVRQNFEYDLRGQLLAVKDASGKDLERYVYDRAGNILSKTVNGKTTTFTYDKANQLVTSTCDGKTTHYRYDAAGRLVQEGDKKYLYRYQDKVAAVWENGRQLANFDYFIDGQVAKATYGAAMEEFLWDDLALIRRGGTTFLNEPHITGGNPVMANDAVMFNDMLGNTLGVQNAAGFTPVAMTAFGETADASAFFTGKPSIPELGYAFLFRNYRADQGKWQTIDPLGYPDGWNNLAYVNNGVTDALDQLGGDIVHLVDPNGAVLGAGHSAWLIGTPETGYTAYDYRPVGSSSSVGSSQNNTGSPAVKSFQTFSQALDYLNRGRDAGHQYTQGQTLTTTPQDDIVAKNRAGQYMTENYALLEHNCYQLGNSVIAAVNQANGTNYSISTYIQPNNAFTANLGKNWMPTAVTE